LHSQPAVRQAVSSIYERFKAVLSVAMPVLAKGSPVPRY
jgi:hypothetical protein